MYRHIVIPILLFAALLTAPIQAHTQSSQAPMMESVDPGLKPERRSRSTSERQRREVVADLDDHRPAGRSLGAVLMLRLRALAQMRELLEATIA